MGTTSGIGSSGSRGLYLAAWAVSAGLAAFAGLATPASAAVIYQDSFNRNGNLSTTAPDIVNTGGATWKDSGQAVDTSTTNGGKAGLNSGGSANLPFTPVLGNVYTLSVDFTIKDPTSAWVALGFITTPLTTSTTTPSTAGNRSGPVLEISGTPAVEAFASLSGNGVSVPSGGSSFASDASLLNAVGTANHVQLVLDTTSANWTISAYLNGVQDGVTATYSTNPSIGGVGFSLNNNATASNFSLAVPEPASLGLLGLGTLALLARRRTRKA